MQRVDSSDYIKAKKNLAIYNEIKRNVPSVNPLKKNGQHYNENFRLALPQTCTGPTDCSGECLTFAKNYELRLAFQQGRDYRSIYCPITTYTVTYDGNGNTSGNPPVDGLSPYNSGSTVTVLGNVGTILPLVNSGYDFDGWNTQPDGSGTAYVPILTFIINGNTILYAMWVESR